MVDGEEDEENDEYDDEQTETFPLVVVPDEQLDRLPRRREPQERRLRSPASTQPSLHSRVTTTTRSSSRDTRVHRAAPIGRATLVRFRPNSIALSGSKLVRSWSQTGPRPALNLSATSFEQVRTISTCPDSSNLLEAGRRPVRSWSRTC